ncbi:uncharacterized protein [Ranitomeya imitator]|uniref:uncharacterized protein n=1 Tax=Ranitomeya imitator TaxID=111125 RepID=UPI0037E7D3BB
MKSERDGGKCECAGTGEHGWKDNSYGDTQRRALAGSDGSLCWMKMTSEDEGLHLETSLVIFDPPKTSYSPPHLFVPHTTASKISPEYPPSLEFHASTRLIIHHPRILQTEPENPSLQESLQPTITKPPSPEPPPHHRRQSHRLTAARAAASPRPEPPPHHGQSRRLTTARAAASPRPEMPPLPNLLSLPHYPIECKSARTGSSPLCTSLSL